MDEEQLGRTVLGILRGLLVADAPEVPHHQPAIRAARAHDGLVLGGPANLENLLGVARKRVQPLVQVPHVEERHGLVRAAGREHVLVERVERQAVHLSLVRLHAVQARPVGGLAGVPELQRLVVADRAEHVLVLAVPSHVLHDTEVARVDGLRVHGALTFAQRALHVPQADLGVVAAREEVAGFKRRPRQSVSLRLVALEPDVGRAPAVRGWLTRVLAVVEDVHVRADRLGGDDELVLGAVAGSVHFAVVVDELDHLDLPGGGAEAADLALVVAAACVDVGVLERELDLGAHQVVLLVLGGVRAEDELLDAVVLAGGLFALGEPLHGERRPLQRVRHHEIVEERGVLLPDLVLLGDHALVLLIRELLIVDGHRCLRVPIRRLSKKRVRGVRACSAAKVLVLRSRRDGERAVGADGVPTERKNRARVCDLDGRRPRRARRG